MWASPLFSKERKFSKKKKERKKERSTDFLGNRKTQHVKKKVYPTLSMIPKQAFDHSQQKHDSPFYAVRKSGLHWERPQKRGLDDGFMQKAQSPCYKLWSPLQIKKINKYL